jgi:hypothetical protein
VLVGVYSSLVIRHSVALASSNGIVTFSIVM